MLTSRNKDKTSENTPKAGCSRTGRKVFRVTRSERSYGSHLDSLCAIAEPGDRIYASLASKDLRAAARLFRERQLAAEYDADPEDFYRNLNTRWVSVLLNKRAAAEDLWLWDCDTAEELDLARQCLPKECLHYEYATKNGTHIVTRPLNPAGLPQKLMACRDSNALMLIGY